MDAKAYIGGKALPTVFNFSANMLEVIDFQIMLIYVCIPYALTF